MRNPDVKNVEKKAMDDIMNEVETIDILINNAGIM